MSRRTDADTLAKLRALLAAAELAPAPLPTPTARTRKRKELAPLTVDLRAMTNTKRHVQIPYAGPAPKTPASAAKLRRVAMQECECRLCALALHPITTFADYQRLQLREPSFGRVAEEREVFTMMRPFTEEQFNRAVQMGVES